MDSDPDSLRQRAEEATASLTATAAALGDGQARESSLLPGWSRGHVLTHLARNADGLGGDRVRRGTCGRRARSGPGAGRGALRRRGGHAGTMLSVSPAPGTGQEPAGGPRLRPPKLPKWM